MPTVLVFREFLLPISETFILAQAGALNEYEAEFCGIRSASPSLSIPGDPILLLTQRDGRLSRFMRRAYEVTRIAPRFHSAIRKLRPELIHAHFAPDGVIASILAEKINIPLIVTLHGYDITVKGDLRRQYSRLWQKADRFICVSQFIKRKAIEAGFPEDKLSVHYIGVDRSKFSMPQRSRTPGLVLFVGRLVEKKGCTHLLDAMRKVQLVQPNAQLAVVGDGPLRKALEQRAADLNLNCRFMGSQPQAIIHEQLAQASIFCAPSVTATNGDSEGLPIVLLEAMAMGVPIVASSSAGIPEAILDRETGLLAGERDHNGLAENIVQFLKDTRFAENCACRASELIASNFDLKAQTRCLEAIYTEVIKPCRDIQQS